MDYENHGATLNISQWDGKESATSALFLPRWNGFLKTQTWIGETVQRIKAFNTMAHSLNLLPGAHLMQEKNQPNKLSS